ncbi:MAG: Ig-like domain-containing protein, partial [Gemmatimonadetes bacterium]|nr:Ig-like domain-containing protein [Gemmatimonadota bacterium]
MKPIAGRGAGSPTVRIVALLLWALLSACQDGIGPGTVADIEVTTPASGLTAGDTLRLVALPKDALGNPVSGRTVAWSSSNEAVATVTPEGVVRGEGPGTATLTATLANRSGSVEVMVSVKRMVSAGGSHTCSLAPSGAAFCWGSNGAGQLGSASASESCQGDPCSTRPLPVSGGLTFLSLSAGSAYT